MTPGSVGEPAAPGKVKKSKRPEVRSRPPKGHPGHYDTVSQCE